ncbi:MAG: hypothetical protein IKO75_14505 [Bacteroidales bacterium]|nr:hypothetical protein [Bacteroidales bacterium]
MWVGRRVCAVTVRPSYCQRCPDSPTLNTPGSLPGVGVGSWSLGGVSIGAAAPCQMCAVGLAAGSWL